jgi:nucleoside-diphosphate-sugar epimerase
MCHPGSIRCPSLINSESELDEVLTRPSKQLQDFIATIPSPLVILGAGGKMGPSLAVLAKRAAETANHPLDVVAVSRFRDSARKEWLQGHGVKALSADLLEPSAHARLPDSGHVVYLVGLKFGTIENPAMTWATNTLVPSWVMERYPSAKVVALSTGNVYGPSPSDSPGCSEHDAAVPVGEYGMSALGRERIFEFYASRNAARVTLLRLFYAVELRYGVLVDIAQKVFRGEAIDVSNDRFNWIWQGEANDRVLRAFDLADNPPSVWNLCQTGSSSVREVATQLGALLDKEPLFAGKSDNTALLGDARKICERLGTTTMNQSVVLDWIAHWVKIGGKSSALPTHFEVRSGRF